MASTENVAFEPQALPMKYHLTGVEKSAQWATDQGQASSDAKCHI